MLTFTGYNCILTKSVARKTHQSLIIRDLSSAGRASALQAEGHRFEPCIGPITLMIISKIYGGIAQLARAHGSYRGVAGSNPVSAIWLKHVDSLQHCCYTSLVSSLELASIVSWDLSSAGRASALQAEGHRFEPCRSHRVSIYTYHGGIAQLARAHGSYPWCRWFKSSFRYLKDLALC